MAENNKPSAKSAAAKAKKKRRRMIKGIVRLVIIFVLLILVIIGGVFLAKKLSQPKYEKAAVTTLHVNDNGSITLEELGVLDGNMKKKELRQAFTDEITAFNTSGRMHVALDEVDLDKFGNVYIRTSYRTAEDYAGYSGYECFTGTVGDAVAAGYDFSSAFMLVTGHAKASGLEADLVKSDTSSKCLIIRENIQVTVPGTILYVSDLSTQVIASDTVLITQRDGNQDATDLVYIIYK